MKKVIEMKKMRNLICYMECDVKFDVSLTNIILLQFY